MALYNFIIRAYPNWRSLQANIPLKEPSSRIVPLAEEGLTEPAPNHVSMHADWAGDIAAAYDAVHQQILHMANGPSTGSLTDFLTSSNSECAGGPLCVSF